MYPIQATGNAVRFRELSVAKDVLLHALDAPQKRPQREEFNHNRSPWQGGHGATYSAHTYKSSSHRRAEFKRRERERIDRWRKDRERRRREEQLFQEFIQYRTRNTFTDKNVAVANAVLNAVLFLVVLIISNVIYNTFVIFDNMNIVNRELAVISLRRHIPKEFALLDYFFALKFDGIEPRAPRYISQDDVEELNHKLKLRLDRPELRFNELIRMMVTHQATDQIKYNYYYYKVYEQALNKIKSFIKNFY